MDVPSQNSQLDETIVVASAAIAPSRSGATPPKVELVSGAGPRLDSETQALLRVRLRAAAVVLLAALTAFLVRDLFIADSPVFWFRLCSATALAGVVGALASRIPFTLAQLRAIEAAVFGMIVVYLGVYEYKLVLMKARAGNPVYELAAIKSCILYFFGVMLLYGTFIPNTWRRAAWTVVPMALVSFVVLVLLRLRSEAVDQFAREVANFEQMSDHVIMMTLGVVAALYGTHIINTLRVEAFKARRMGQYHLKELIGSGGMGEVYLAEHCLLKRPCALKLIRPGNQSDPVALERFEREVRTTASLTHWNTINIFDYGRTEDGTFFYVMELLPGLSLNDLVKRFGPLPGARVIHLFRQTCGALREAHAAGLIHRDIKPANIFVSRLGGVCDVAKLLDFGLVRQIADESATVTPQDRVVSGSPLYMAPEQALAGRECDARSDIYSLGATAYYAVTGRAPFDGETSVKVMIAHTRAAVVPPSKLQSDIPGDLEAIILRCLAKAPVDRFADVAELERALAVCDDAGLWTDETAATWWADSGLQPGAGDAAGQAGAASRDKHEHLSALARALSPEVAAARE